MRAVYERLRGRGGRGAGLSGDAEALPRRELRDRQTGELVDEADGDFDEGGRAAVLNPGSGNRQ